MKKLLVLGIFILSLFLFFGQNMQVSAECSIEGDNFTIAGFLNDCKPDRVVGGAGGDDFTIDRGTSFGAMIQRWITNISFLLGILAVGAIVYSGLLMQLSAGEDEKIKKSKDIFKWTVIGFLLLISVNAIIYLVVTLAYELA